MFSLSNPSRITSTALFDVKRCYSTTIKAMILTPHWCRYLSLRSSVPRQFDHLPVTRFRYCHPVARQVSCNCHLHLPLLLCNVARQQLEYEQPHEMVD